ncbi:hypothetical protein SMKC069_36100 [Serratia marcescens]|nr:hypothetical protein SMKC069_36100 [Serratia marcescens]
MKNKNMDIILRFLIRNYAINGSSSFDSLFSDGIEKTKLYTQAYNEFKINFQFYVNRYLALSYIYHSMINAGSTFSSMVLLEEVKIINLDRGPKDTNFYYARNEPFGHQIIMQYAKLYEALVNIDALEGDSNKFNENEKRHALKILDSDKLKDAYVYLNDLRNRIESSGALKLRNNIFAHPFKDGGAGSVVFLEQVTSKVYSILRDLCDETDREKYEGSDNRIRFFCSNYIMRAVYGGSDGCNALSSIEKQFAIKTKAQKHIIALYEFMSILRGEKLLGVEPFLIVDINTVKAELKDILY